MNEIYVWMGVLGIHFLSIPMAIVMLLITFRCGINRYLKYLVLGFGIGTPMLFVYLGLLPFHATNIVCVLFSSGILLFWPEHPDEDPKDLSFTSDYVQWLAATGYNEMSPIAGIFKSFHDAPGGFREELREIYWGVGAEYNYNDQFFLRGGYHYENEYKGNRKYFTVGAGFQMNVFSLDAAYLISTAQSNPLDQTLRFTLSFDMDGIKQILGR